MTPSLNYSAHDIVVLYKHISKLISSQIIIVLQLVISKLFCLSMFHHIDSLDH